MKRLLSAVTAAALCLTNLCLFEPLYSVHAAEEATSEWDAVLYGQYDSWQEAYYDLISYYYNQHYGEPEVLANMVRFEPFDLNGDGRPELVFSSGDYHMADVYIFTFTDGYLTLAGTLTGSWGKIGTTCGRKYIYNSDSHMGVIQTYIYQLSENQLTPVISFVNSVDAAVDSGSNYYKGYKINDNIVSAEEYNSKLDTYTVQTPQDSLSIGKKYTFSDLKGTDNGFEYQFLFDQVAISGYNNQDSNVTIPSTINGLPVTSIASFAFYDMDAIKKVSIPETVVKIQSYSFYECDSLTQVRLPSSLRFIECAFPQCDSLQSIDISADNPFYAVQDGVLFDKQRQALIQYPAGKSASVYTVPDTVTMICTSAFAGAVYLKSVTLPESVENIYEDAFFECRNLSDVYILNKECGIWDFWDDGTGETINNYAEYNNDTYYFVYFFNGTIHGYAGSTAEDYAYEHCRKFASLEGDTSPQNVNAEPWRKAYIRYLRNLSRQFDGSVGQRTNYSLIDFDQNGIPELVMADKGQNYINDQPQVFTYSDGMVTKVSEYVEDNKFGSGWWSIYSPSLYANTEYGYYYCDYESQMLFFKYNGKQFVLESILQKWDNDYRYNGYSTTKANYDQQLQKYKSVLDSGIKVNYEFYITNFEPVLNYNKPEPQLITTTAAPQTSTLPPITTTTSTVSSVTTQPITTVSTLPVTDFVRGDVNSDGEVSVDDAQLTLKAYTERMAGNDMKLTDEQFKAADVDGNGEISVEDAQWLLKYYTEKYVAGKDITWDDIFGKKT